MKKIVIWIMLLHWCFSLSASEDTSPIIYCGKFKGSAFDLEKLSLSKTIELNAFIDKLLKEDLDARKLAFHLTLPDDWPKELGTVIEHRLHRYTSIRSAEFAKCISSYYKPGFVIRSYKKKEIHERKKAIFFLIVIRLLQLL